ncbi:MAG: hypothetical protein EB056_04140 [Verrucomicrobia bacterium]|nr:hypothetical protein [Verrucomicrobiota bacterium]
MQKHFSLVLTLMAAVLIAGCAVKDPKDPRFVVAEGKGIKITRGQLDAEVNRALTNFGQGSRRPTGLPGVEHPKSDD